LASSRHKITVFLGTIAASLLRSALASSRHKITVFLGTITILVTILGAAMYLIEGHDRSATYCKDCAIPLAVPIKED